MCVGGGGGGGGGGRGRGGRVFYKSILSALPHGATGILCSVSVALPGHLLY